MPPLVFAGEARNLTERLGQVAGGRGLPAPGRRLRRVLRRLLGRRHPRQAQGHPADGRRAHLLRRRAGGEGRPHRRPVRQAPLAPTPRPIDGVELPSFRGHIVNDIALHRGGPRRPTPSGCCTAYHQSASTLNLLRAFTKGGFADLSRVHALEPGVRGVQPARASATSSSPTRSTGPCASCRPAASTPRPSRSCTRSTSSPATRPSSSATRRRSPGRTRSPATGTTARPTCSGSASAPASSTAPTSSSCRGVGNPVGCKIGPTATPDEVARPVRGAQPRPGARAASRSSAAWAPTRSSRRAAAAARGRSATPATRSCGPATRCTATPSPSDERPQDPPLRRDPRRDRRLLRRPPRRGHLARRRARRAHRRRRHRVPRRRRGDPRRRPRRPATRRCATPASTAASPSTSPSGSPSCCETLSRPGSGVAVTPIPRREIVDQSDRICQDRGILSRIRLGFRPR